MKKVKSSACIATSCVIVVAAMAGRLSADTPQSSYHLPPNEQVIAYLLQSVNWYRHAYAERLVANDPADLLFLNDNQAIEVQITRLSFEFAKADAVLATTASSRSNTPATPAPNNPSPSNLTHFTELKNRSDQLSQQAIRDIDTLNEKIGAARKPSDRKNLRAALDSDQRRLELLNAVSETVNELIEFAQTVGAGQTFAGSLDSTIDDLAQSIPEVTSPPAPLAKLAAQDASSKTTASEGDYGTLQLAGEVSALHRKLRVVDDKLRLTDDLARSAANLRIPMTGFITRVLQSGAISDLQTSDLSLLRQQESQLGVFTLQLKGFSPAIVALDKQRELFVEYKSHLASWRTEVASQYKQELRRLVIHLLTIALIIGVLIGVGEVSRRLALGRVQDPYRQRIISVIHRLLTLLTIAVVALFGVTSDLSSLPTYFGLLTAGMAVSLQNVILASLSYLVLVGKRGIRIGDRLQVSGVTGDVIDMGLLQFQLREFDVQKQRFTGHVATFSNSVVFLPPGSCLLKFNSDSEKEANGKVNQSRTDPMERGSAAAEKLTSRGAFPPVGHSSEVSDAVGK